MHPIDLGRGDGGAFREPLAFESPVFCVVDRVDRRPLCWRVASPELVRVRVRVRVQALVRVQVQALVRVQVLALASVPAVASVQAMQRR